MIWHKYRAKKTFRDGIVFASKLEAALYDILKLKVTLGEISDLKTQEKVYLTRAKILYKPDFSYIENGKRVFAEAKGMDTPAWKIKRKLWLFYGPGQLKIFKGSHDRLRLSEILTPSIEIND